MWMGDYCKHGYLHCRRLHGEWWCCIRVDIHVHCFTTQWNSADDSEGDWLRRDGDGCRDQRFGSACNRYYCSRDGPGYYDYTHDHQHSSSNSNNNNCNQCSGVQCLTWTHRSGCCHDCISALMMHVRTTSSVGVLLALFVVEHPTYP